MWYSDEDVLYIDKGVAYTIKEDKEEVVKHNPMGFIWEDEKKIETNI